MSMNATEVLPLPGDYIAVNIDKIGSRKHGKRVSLGDLCRVAKEVERVHAKHVRMMDAVSDVSFLHSMEGELL